jgi:formylglycine-generating enzyme required for sulfatase activity
MFLKGGDEVSDIFISYSRKDKAKAQIIAEALAAKGCSVWWDTKIPPGKTWDEVIKEALNSAKSVIVLWSHESVSSDYVKEEAEYGKKRRILIPVLIDDVEIPFGFGRIQAAILIDWEGALPHPQFDLLLDSISKILGRPLCSDEGETGKKKPKGKIELAAKQVEHEAPRKKEAIPKTYTNSIGMKFALIPAGEFEMGSPSDEEGRLSFEGPVHRVKISKPFYLGIYPVTQKEWKAIIKWKYGPWNSASGFEGDDLPVNSIWWNNIMEYIRRLNKKEGPDKYRLPSEAEWEYAARAGTTTKYSFGDDESELGDYAWYSGNSDSKTHPVGQKKQNPWGLYDIHGNVWEWVLDSWHDNYSRAPADGSAWKAGDVDNFTGVARGGSWDDLAGLCRSAHRKCSAEGFRYGGIGFRLLREI